MPGVGRHGRWKTGVYISILILMSYRAEVLAPGHVYHIYNRGVNKGAIFTDTTDRQRFIDALIFYLPKIHPGSFALETRSFPSTKRSRILLNRKAVSEKSLVDLVAYCLMDNHIHILLHENVELGISQYLQRLFTSYAKYFNIKYERVGPLFSGRFRAVRVKSDEQLLHVSRYIHLNPYVAGSVKDPFEYTWSSLSEYTHTHKVTYAHIQLLRSMMSPTAYRSFVTDYAEYARELESIKHLLLE